MPARTMVSPFRSRGTNWLDNTVTPLAVRISFSAGTPPTAHSWLPVT